MLRMFRRRLYRRRQYAVYHVCYRNLEADVTLTDEASHELLLLDRCADAALEVAFVEHSGILLGSVSVCCMPNDFITQTSYR